MSPPKSADRAPQRQLHLNLNALYAGTHRAAWKAPGADPLGVYDLKQWQRVAEICERGTFDALFLAETLAFFAPPSESPALAFDPAVLLASLASSTTHLGLVGTGTTTYDDPFHTARRYASLDHLSGGRAGWNAVTSASPNVAKQFGSAAHPDRSTRYARADEFISVVTELWDSWEDEALVGDAAGGVFADGARIHRIDHRGAHFDVEGPSLVPRSPQGRPVQLQAGQSEGGRDLAARHAEAIFASLATLDDAKAFSADIRRRLVAHGRPADAIRILPGLVFTLGGTEAEAHARHDALNEQAGDAPLVWLAGQIGADPDDLRWDEPLPQHVLDIEELPYGSRGARDIVVVLARREGLTVREILRRVSGWHRLVVGTPEQLADTITEWFQSGYVDGFNLMPDVTVSGARAFVDHVVPILRKRGIFRHEYEGTTLRDHLGLPRPASQFAAARSAA